MVSPIPNNPDIVRTSSTDYVKAATPQYILQTNTGMIEADPLASLIFEEIGGQELISIVRSDMVNGQNLEYVPIRNLSSMSKSYGPQTLVALQSPSNKYFNSFPLKLDKYIPDSGLGPAGSIVYIDPTTRDLVINLINLAPGEMVEVQILNRGSVLSDTIY